MIFEGTKKSIFFGLGLTRAGGAMPDITYLPVLAEYFGVSIDQLMGIVPLTEESYIASKTGTREFWEAKLEYLLRTRKSMWNDD